MALFKIWMSHVFIKSWMVLILFLILYLDNILPIGNDVRTLSSVRVLLPTQFSMKDMGEVIYVLCIKLLRNGK